MAIPRNASLTSIMNQLLEDYAGVFGYFPSSVDLFTADLFDTHALLCCAVKEEVTPDQYEDYFGINNA